MSSEEQESWERQVFKAINSKDRDAFRNVIESGTRDQLLQLTKHNIEVDNSDCIEYEVFFGDLYLVLITESDKPMWIMTRGGRKEVTHTNELFEKGVWPHLGDFLDKNSPITLRRFIKEAALGDELKDEMLSIYNKRVQDLS
jgi:hypothetical protein|eukprot:CAMPEP_0174293146 /NCGR_PEP_ID=MMETSP0809-20121228/37634_1 /TAXON_ID=73025 ORGANISM="Eutreptiella gymnastica-like, Strain CCMP1594" /NCGR_SAMPLE_ID=MMETSP0809 /ASSEMBLY_ACC=CAM_ASM_000658 /LENGTH=141 /DNA_ID=CAMNT_0015393713 /DNA_START=16 /DNA_END=441 /DNA_ORIENTATION=+